MYPVNFAVHTESVIYADECVKLKPSALPYMQDIFYIALLSMALYYYLYHAVFFFLSWSKAIISRQFVKSFGLWFLEGNFCVCVYWCWSGHNVFATVGCL